MKTVTQLIAASLVFAATVPVYATASDFMMDTSSIGQSHNGVVSSEQLLELGGEDAGGLRLEGESSLREGNIDRALMVLQRSVEMGPGDIDGRILYAQALEQKLTAQKVRDPELYNFCTRQWFYVFKKSEFPDQSIQARAHLINLTGIAPRHWDTEQKYLAKVALPEPREIETKVAAHVVQNQPQR
jgi:hypothetical protein